jgi:alpha-L-fucosidase
MDDIKRNPDAVGEQHAALGLDTARQSIHTLHPEAQWFPRAGLGLFIHWGIASVHGDLDLSWSMIANTGYDLAAQGRNKVTPEQYWQLAERFQPDRYDPDKWLAAAVRAGMQYAVLTTMHHDGYTLWPSRFSDFGVQSHFGGRDLVAPFVEACRRHGLKVGLYYSPPDWYADRNYRSFNYGSEDKGRFPGRPHFNIRHEPCELPPRTEEHVRRMRDVWLGRTEELLTRYGRIDLLWFDGGAKDNAVRDRARELQPHIVINSRSCDGDFDCTECSLPKARFRGWFETPHCWQASDIPSPNGGMVDFWGYLKYEQYKSTAWMFGTLAQLRTWGGNLLINVGPRPDGELPGIVYERLEETARWMAHSREAIIGALPGPYPERCSVPVTIQPGGHIWYLHLLPEGTGEARLTGVDMPIRGRLLRTGEPVAIVQEEGGVVKVFLTPAQRTVLVDVVAVEWDW